MGEAAEQSFAERLVRSGRITSTQLAEALLQQPAARKPIGPLLVELGAMDERVLAAELASHYGLAAIDLREVEPDPAAVKLLPEATARAWRALPLRLVEGRLQFAVAQPLDAAGMDQLSRSVGGRPVELFLTPASDVLRVIESSYRALIDVDRLVKAFQASDVILGEAVVDDRADDAPVVQLVGRIITQGLRDRASDVHIEPQDGRTRVRFRIDGALHDVLALPQNIGPAVVSRLKIMADLNIADRRRAQDGQFELDIDDRPIDVRINTCPSVWGEKAVLRILDRRRVLYRLDALGMAPETDRAYSRLVQSPFGMVICAGPTGSGKTTTLYATLAEVNEIERNVTTIEDPVEYVFPGITQIEINEAAGLSFAKGLRAILRQDPDVILVGEIRDAETARIAVESALTGHLVLSSIHATDACSALQRLVDMGIEPFLIVSTVIGVVSQRLVRRTCRHCRVPYQPLIEELAFCAEHGLSDAATLTYERGQGCNFCSRTGYQDRVGVFELVEMHDEIKRLLVTRSPADDLRAAARRSGTRSLVEGGLDLVSQGQTTISEIMRATYTK